ncbi:MAG: nitroreductase [Alphaproteobacteria bacterium]
MEYWAGKQSDELIEYLLKRRSLKVSEFVSGGPDKEQLETLIRAASRVPDHGKTNPFYFLVFQGQARGQAGEIFARIFAEKNEGCGEAQLDKERQRFTRADTVIGVIYRARKAKHPLWEQMMSAGAACQNLILASNALGFAAQWLTEWYAYDEDVRQVFGLDSRDVVAGFIYIGKPGAEPEERDRPDLDEIVTYWSQGAELKKGERYDKEKFDLPDLGFKIKNNN